MERRNIGAFRAPLESRLLRRLRVVGGFLVVTRVFCRPRRGCFLRALLLRRVTSGATMVGRCLDVKTGILREFLDKEIKYRGSKLHHFDIVIVEMSNELRVRNLVGEYLVLRLSNNLRQGVFAVLVGRFGRECLRLEVNKGRDGSYHVRIRVARVVIRVKRGSRGREKHRQTVRRFQVTSGLEG